MDQVIQTHILQFTHSTKVDRVEVIQPLWNGYGTLSRVHLSGGQYQSVIVKHIKVPQQASHPRGLASSLSKQRKRTSYRVELNWYLKHNHQSSSACPTPQCLKAIENNGELILLLEDLATLGFTQVLDAISLNEVKVVLTWLARFHAHYLGYQTDELWDRGTYWHLATRPEELERIKGSRLYDFASLLDARLEHCQYSTLVHGDAKLANFCFSDDLAQVAAVDFQYVGRGSGVQDVAYFLGSCLRNAECEAFEEELLNHYFEVFKSELRPSLNADQVEAEWRSLYPVAWADFERFMLGWNPIHQKLTPYSQEMTERAIHLIMTELSDVAREACLEAGRLIQSYRNKSYHTSYKGLESPASDIVTEVDLHAQKLILDHLISLNQRYQLGVLAEEGDLDQSRTTHHAFWAIDPLDGTQFFTKGVPGYATSIALVTRSGKALLGVVYDPVKEQLFQAIKGKGVQLNGKPLSWSTSSALSQDILWLADSSLRKYEYFTELTSHFTISFSGGAVINTLQLLTSPRSCYCKPPKPQLGGCAIWDLAAVSLMVEEIGGSVTTFSGKPLDLNRKETIYFNDVGLVFTSPDLTYDEFFETMNEVITLRE